MRRYLLYEQAHKQLKRSGLIPRLEEAEKLYQYVAEDEIPSFIHAIYDQHQPLTQAARDHLIRTNKIYADPHKHSWRVHKPTDTRIKPTNKDQLVLAGWPLLDVLSPEEFYDHKRFGFETPAALITTASAYIQNKTLTDTRPRRWQATHEDKRYETEITGTPHGDLFIRRVDTTLYPAHAPFGTRVDMRPLRAEDQQLVQA